MLETTPASSRKQQILEALAKLLEGSPDIRITTALLARAVGVSEAALYRHFPSKTRMYEDLVAFAEEALFSRLRAIAEEPITTEEYGYKSLLLVLGFFERNPGIARLVTGEAISGEPVRLHRRISQLFDRLETELRQRLRDGEFNEGLKLRDTRTTCASVLMAFIEGRIRQFVRSDFTRSMTPEWQSEWALLRQALFAA
ncbi:MAG: nucleoid occlusion factor SlmA [Porticoccaceae bacterium]|nr:nucleoid occlusion factor SlmA [Porticoccaceae bacterium]